MVPNPKQHNAPTRSRQGFRSNAPPSNQIGASTPYNFRGKNLTPYGGLLAVATLLEKLGFRALLEPSIRVRRRTRAMTLYQFLLALVLGA